jgi:hypothetical protein
MRRLLQTFALALLALPAMASDQAFTANLAPFSQAPSRAYLRAVITGCPDVANLAPQYFYPDGNGQISSTITPDTDISLCAGAVGVTQHRLEVWQMAGAAPDATRDTRLYYGSWFIGATAFNFNTAAPANSVVNPIASDQSNYAITRPFRRLALANFPVTCNAGKDWIERSDPVVRGEVDYRCNAAGNGWDLAAPGSTASMNLETPTTGDSGKFQFKFAAPVTVRRISCSTDSGTVTINLEQRSESTPNTSGTAVLGSGLVCDATSPSQTSFAAAVVAQEAPLALTISATSGNPGVVRIHVETSTN